VTHRAPGVRPAVVAVLAAAAIAALTFAPGPADAGTPVASAADKAGDVYKADVAKAKAKRAAALERCKSKPTKAKRKACRKKAKAAFKEAKQKAAAKRDKARENAGGQGGGGQGEGPKSPADQREEMRDCIRDGGRPSDCRQDARKP
jgi:hypothetical protein